jgi:hypothetical protein
VLLHQSSDPARKRLYRLGGWAALGALAVVVIEGLVVVIIQAVWLNSGQYGPSFGGQPSTAIGWFELFQSNRLIGLLDDAALDIAVAALMVPLFLALFVALRRANEAWMVVAAPLAVAAVAAYLPTNTSFSLLYASDQYWAATSDAQRSLLLSSGQGVIETGGNGLFWSVGFLLIASAGLIVAWVMLRGNIFGRPTAWAGLLANGLYLANYASLASVTETSALSTVLVGSATALLAIWWILIARRLFQLGRGVSEVPRNLRSAVPP